MATLFGMRGGGGVTTSKWIVGAYPQGLQPLASTIRPAKSAHDSMASLKLATSLNTAAAASARSTIFPTVGVLQTKRVNFAGPALFTPTRHVHSDVDFPNFESYRYSEACRDPTKPASETEDERRMGLYGIVYGVGGMVTMVIGRDALIRVIDVKAMPADVRAMASIEVKLSDVPEGSTKTFEWRGKPVFVRHRTADEVTSLREVDVASLRDPETDEVRVQRPEWSVVLGICTHLGCVPIADAGDFGGYFCPCHGSHYDGSGRVRKGPAPKNLEVPEYSFGADETVIVGKP